jgi:hypothetical protein
MKLWIRAFLTSSKKEQYGSDVRITYQNFYHGNSNEQ